MFMNISVVKNIFDNWMRVNEYQLEKLLLNKYLQQGFQEF